MRFLLTNDDGVHAEGLLALKKALDPLGAVTVVAPDRPRSACGHTITLHKPLRLSETRLADGSAAWVGSGTPTDCVVMAMLGVMAAAPPDLLFSGINQGPNLGWDLTYSGTVAAAMEGVIGGVPSVAISLAWRFKMVVEEDEVAPRSIDYSHAAAYAARLALYLRENPLPEHTFLNVNYPDRRARGVKATRQGVRRYPGALDRRVDPMGRAYYWLGGDEPIDLHEEGTDVTAVAEGYVSITPVQLDLTDHALLDRFARRPLPGAS